MGVTWTKEQLAAAKQNGLREITGEKRAETALPAKDTEPPVQSSNKYHAHGFYDADGNYWHSKGEYNQWLILRSKEREGIISELERQKKFPLIINGIKVGVYTCDYYYKENGKYIPEDFKGFFTTESKLRIKVFEALYNLKVRITGR